MQTPRADRLLWLLAVAAVGTAAADTLTPIEFRQVDTPYNLQSLRGVPISAVVGTPPGSDGRMPTGINESGTPNLPTERQFQSFTAFGAVPAATNWVMVSNSPVLQGANAFSATVATDMQLPRAYSDGAVSMVLRRGQVGAPYLARRVDLAFGSLVEVPATDETGAALSVVKETYWQPEPYSEVNHTNTGYYYSPHAEKVFAIQAGPLQVTWRKMVPYSASTLPTDYVNQFGAKSFETNGTSIYLLYTVNYVASGSAAKPPKKMYWTEREFRLTGLPVTVPAGRVSLVNVLYNNNFPRTVAEEYRGPGYTSPIEGSTNQTLSELRTLWYDPGLGCIFAHNHEGRAFVEFLGDASPDGQRREHLGFEIVDVFKNPVSADLTVELGERLVPPAPESADALDPHPIETIGATYVYRHTDAASGRLQLYATRVTRSKNDSLVHWLEEGVVGVKWPNAFVRYAQVWPTDAAKYSHYVRPLAANEAEARQTAVLLPTQNAPMIAYQDPLDQPRAKLTETFGFYTWLTPQYPAHRTLLRYASGSDLGFERIFSWLDANLRATNFTGSVAAELAAWNPTNQAFAWPSALTAPRVVEETVYVGDRLAAPTDEPGASGYLAGFINTAMGRLYHPGAYVDPFVDGFTEANQGAIIPVNAVPGTNRLEVWWFRTNSVAAGLNAGNNQLGFLSVFWPSVLGRYTIEWPPNPREIVLASKLGSGTLDTFEAQGTIYRQNEPSLPGYNPNEEHALMAGGTAFATRDDLNLTSGDGYSSEPFVLVQYTAGDGRPAVSAFKVLREKPSAGYVFDYVSPAGQILQPPMPLPLLEKPVSGTGDTAVNFNAEPAHAGGDLPGGWAEHGADPLYAHYARFTWRDRHHDFWIYRGPHSGLPVLQAGRYLADTGTWTGLPDATAVVGGAFSYTVHASRQDEYLAVTIPTGQPSWLFVSGLTLHGTPEIGDVGESSLEVVVEDLYDHTRVTNTLDLSVLAIGSATAQIPLALVSSNSCTGSVVVFSNRPPFLAASPTPANSFTMRYYYKTDASFDWPGMANPPTAGMIVPYLRAIDPETGAYLGDAASSGTPSLEIVYRPVWPERDPSDSSKAVPILPFGATLATPRFNLPGVRDMLTAEVLYQQSVAADLGDAMPSVVLHDATREKFADLTSQQLMELPGGIATDIYQGQYYFPNLPPHLAERLFYDPNRGTTGSLVLRGEYVPETLGESYLLLNVLRGSDLEAVKALCPDGDPDKAKWTSLVESLATDLETFYENPSVPGTYIPQPGKTVAVGVESLAEVNSANTAVDSYAVSATGPGSGYVTLVEGSGTAFTEPGDPVAMHVFRVDGSQMYAGELKVIAAANPLNEYVTFQHTPDLAGRFDEFEYEWKIAQPVDGLPPESDATMSRYLALASGTDMPRRTLGGAGIQALCDNYVVMRYRAKDADHPLCDQWSDWTAPKLAEGWIKRVLAGINPFNQRITDLFNNPINTQASMLAQAGKRWEGDVALNLESMNQYGLIEIYETVLRRGRMLSIESGYNFGPANDALLLAAGYLSDLYMMLGGEAWADAANPTIGIGTRDPAYGDVATALFAFKGQTSSLLEEELALLRGRDDFLLPGVQVAPVYNRLVWNYTRGIDAGEVIYALNYNIQENPDDAADGVINAEDAARLYPQGHGDAYGHYLTALKGYYSLLLNSCFDWVPRIEAVNVLGQPISVDYQDERKFAAAAAAVARAGLQTFELTWRRDYQPIAAVGWDHLGASRTNAQRTYVASGDTNRVSRHWGVDHWASRTAQGAYLNWVVGNAMLPDIDPNPLHEGIQKIDRMTVPELRELAAVAEGLQTDLDNAEAGLSPLGLPEGGLAFDINPNAVVGVDNGTHFEQIYQRAKSTLNNAVVSFDDAKDVTRLMRSEQDSLTDFQARVDEQELAFRNSLLELYGSPYPEDIGPGKTWPQGYDGPDLIHYAYVDLPESALDDLLGTRDNVELIIIPPEVPSGWWADVLDNKYDEFDENKLYSQFGWSGQPFSFNVGPHGFFDKPPAWTGRRATPGRVQQGISEFILAHEQLRQSISSFDGAVGDFDNAVRLFTSGHRIGEEMDDIDLGNAITDEVLQWASFANDVFEQFTEMTEKDIYKLSGIAESALPKTTIAGMAVGGDLTSGASSALTATKVTATMALEKADFARWVVFKSLETATETRNRWSEYAKSQLEGELELQQQLFELGSLAGELGDHYVTIAENFRRRDDALRRYQALLAEGLRIQEERLVFRQHAAAVIQGYRTRDAAFRLFRNEKLERYKTLFDLAARYALLAANAYDYETGLLGTSAGRDFKKRIINARALGVVRNGEPQYAGSNTGDPGLSSTLAEMKSDWDVLRGRLGFNNPDAYGTSGSLRTEAHRILPSTDGDASWKDLLQAARMRNLLDDADVRRSCMQIDDGSGLPVPGLILTFSTTIADGYNLFGRELAAGDHAFTPTAFATKVFGVGVAFEGYRGMDNPSANSGTVGNSGSSSPGDPDLWYLDPLALASTPYVYLIPVGVDSMRIPPLGDASAVRTWAVEDLAIPMPFNIGESDFATQSLWQSSDSLTETLFAIRKHQAFRPVSSTALFSANLYTGNGTLQRSQYTNNRLVGRSVWNSQWKLVIPGRTLLNDPNEGLDRFVQTVTDIKLHFVTYSYSGN